MGAARDVVEQLIGAMNGRDLELARRLIAEDARVITAQGRRLDADGLRQLVSGTYAAFSDLEITVTRWVEDGDVVVTEEVMAAIHSGPFAGLEPTGRRVELPMVHVHRVAAGQIVERVTYYDTARILRQLTA
jgi:steroid delta-isomerase-like uncharacterized protein